MEQRKLVLRADKIAFMKVGEEYHRMRGFKSLPTAKNPIEYSRQYVDEYFETTDVVGMSESKDFEFDQYVNDPVHEYLVDIIDNEKLGSEAIVEIVTVDKGLDTDNAVVRKYSVVAESYGDGTEAFTYTGRFSAISDIERTDFTISEDGLTATNVGGI